MGRINFSTPPDTPKKDTGNPPVINQVFILDASGSMGEMNYKGTKLYNAVDGIQEIIDANNAAKDRIVHTTLIVFSSNVDFILYAQKGEVQKIRKLIDTARYGGSTSLYDAICKCIKHDGYADGAMLVNIFTDGEENTSTHYKLDDCREMIQNAIKDKWTITFVGTQHDVLDCQKKFGLLEGNLLIHDNTGEGIKKSLTKTLNATQSYVADLTMGLDVTDGFYKKM